MSTVAVDLDVDLVDLLGRLDQPVAQSAKELIVVELLRRRRHPDTLSAWLDRYQAEGIAGLTIRPGRGRTPAFPHPLPR